MSRVMSKTMRCRMKAFGRGFTEGLALAAVIAAKLLLGAGVAAAFLAALFGVIWLCDAIFGFPLAALFVVAAIAVTYVVGDAVWDALRGRRAGAAP